MTAIHTSPTTQHGDQDSTAKRTSSVIPVSRRQKICLSKIVTNEAPVISRCLESVRPHRSARLPHGTIEHRDDRCGVRTLGGAREHERRISACRLTFVTEVPGAEFRQNGAFVQNAITLTRTKDERQPGLWQDRVRLDDGFWRSLREHPVPVREEAVRAIGARSLALDVYIWLAYRLHVLKQPTPVSWAALHGQFGAGFKAVRQLKPTLREALALALAVYPEAKVGEEASGVVLYPSLPAVPRAEAKRLGLG
jgi:Plasmid encoded RepA protein